jgi:hypothetical protein
LSETTTLSCGGCCCFFFLAAADAAAAEALTDFFFFFSAAAAADGGACATWCSPSFCFSVAAAAALVVDWDDPAVDRGTGLPNIIKNYSARVDFGVECLGGGMKEARK